MTRARVPRPQEVAAARRDPRLLRAAHERHEKAWRARGACQVADPDTFFPAPVETAADALAWCRRCAVAGACLAWALSVGKDCYGVWGGTTIRERRAMLVAWHTEEQPEEAAFHTPGAQPDLVVSAGRLKASCPASSSATAHPGATAIPRQRRAESGQANVPDAVLLRRERAHAA